MPMATKLGRMVAYHDVLLPINSHGPSIYGLARSRDKLKPLYLYYHSASHHQTWWDGYLPCGFPAHKVIWLFGRSCDKLKPINLLYHRAYGHQTCQGVDLPWDAPFQNVKWLLRHAAGLFKYVQSCEIMWSIENTSAVKIPMANKPVRVVTYNEEVQHITS